MTKEPIFLYVEDDLVSRQIISVLITRVLGFKNLTMFENTRDFKSKISALNPVPDVIFLDIQIQPHDGYATLDMLRNDPQYTDSTIIAMTANVMSYHVEKLKEAGFDGLIGKPIVTSIFPDLVKRIQTGEPVWYVP